MIFIEKVGVVDQIKHVIDSHGIAFVNTQGHFAEYPKVLVSKIEKGVYVAILTDFDCAGIHIAEKVIEEVIALLGPAAYTKTGKKKIIRLGVDIPMLDYFVSRGIQNKDTSTNESVEVIGSTDRLMEITEETYSQPKDKTKRRPAMNVVSAVIKYVKKYFLYNDNPDRYPQYAAYSYIYDNFEYLTGLSPDIVAPGRYFEGDPLIYRSESEEAEAIAKAIAHRNNQPSDPNLPSTAKRIELDSVIKVVRANLFAQFIVDTLKDNFPVLNYNRAVDKPTEYFTNKFNILPEKVQKLFLHITDKADVAIEPTDKDIEAELEAVDVNEVGGGGGDLLDIEVEEIQNERLRIQAIDKDPDMQLIEEACSKLLDSLDPDANGSSSSSSSSGSNDDSSSSDNDGWV